jgi:hypothetical protein
MKPFDSTNELFIPNYWLCDVNETYLPLSVGDDRAIGNALIEPWPRRKYGLGDHSGSLAYDFGRLVW